MPAALLQETVPSPLSSLSHSGDYPPIWAPPLQISLASCLSLSPSLSSADFYSSDPSGTLNFNGKAILHAEGVNFSNGAKFSISMDQLKLDEELGKGNYGTVKKVLHVPTNVYMAMKVRLVPLVISSISGPLLGNPSRA